MTGAGFAVTGGVGCDAAGCGGVCDADGGCEIGCGAGCDSGRRAAGLADGISASALYHSVTIISESIMLLMLIICVAYIRPRSIN